MAASGKPTPDHAHATYPGVLSCACCCSWNSSRYTKEVIEYQNIRNVFKGLSLQHLRICNHGCNLGIL